MESDAEYGRDGAEMTFWERSQSGFKPMKLWPIRGCLFRRGGGWE